MITDESSHDVRRAHREVVLKEVRRCATGQRVHGVPVCEVLQHQQFFVVRERGDRARRHRRRAAAARRRGRRRRRPDDVAVLRGRSGWLAVWGS